MVLAIEQLQNAGVDADVWKIEGLDCRQDCERIGAAARSNGRDRVGCIVLGRREDALKVPTWLRTPQPCQKAHWLCLLAQQNQVVVPFGTAIPIEQRHWC